MSESSHFRQYSKKLDELLIIEREVPWMLTCNDFGSAKEVWSLICSKDEINERNWRNLPKHKNITTQYRYLIVDWLMAVCAALKLQRETFHLAIDYFDRYLCISDSFPLIEIQKVAAAALAIASKYEEYFSTPIEVISDFTDGGASVEEIAAKELKMLMEMSWNVSSITAIQWLGIYLQLLSKLNQINNNNNTNNNNVHINTESITVPTLLRDDFIILSKVIDLLILDYHFLPYHYRQLAAAVVFCFYESPEDIEKITCIKKESIEELISVVQIFVDFCEEESRKNVYHQTFKIEDVRGDEVHLIQTYEGSNWETQKKIKKIMKEIEKKQQLCAMVRVKLDNRIRTLIENGVAKGHRSMFVVVGDKAKDQVVTLHQILTKSIVGARPSVLWCYKKDLGFSSHRKKRMREVRKKIATGMINSKEDDPFEVFVSSTDIRYCYYNESHKILGNTYGALVLQDFEAITPNLLARTIETVEGGGLVILLLQSVSSLRQLFTMSMDVHSRYRTESHSEIVPRFNERFILSLSSCKSCVVMDDQLNILPISSHIANIEPVPAKMKTQVSPQQQELSDLQQAMADSKPIGQLLRQCKTADQGKALLRLLDVVTEKTLRATCSITAARGRGKSASLGLAIAGAIGFGYSNIFITSPSPENLKTLFEFVIKGFEVMDLQEHGDYELIQSTNPDFNKALVRINVFKDHRQTIQYIHPTDAAKLGQAELVVIDEAAAIPLPLVKDLISGPYLVFLASTINGYEGTGRSLSLKLLQQLRKQSALAPSTAAANNTEKTTSSRALHEITLEESIRYKPGDEIETWLTKVLCLDATNVHHMLTGTPPPKECELYYVNRDTLFSFHKASEAFLSNLMSIYVSAHYKNTPNDLQMLSDAPAHHVFVLLGPVKEENKKVPEVLAVVQVCLEGSLSKNTVKTSFESGRRGTGDLLPWTVSQQFLENNFATLAGARIVRLAVHPDFQGMGYGSRALQLLQQYYQGEFPCLKENVKTNDKKIRSINNHETVALLEEQIAPRENLPSLLVRLEERTAERLDYLGVSFGLTLNLLKFWKKAGFAPVYLRQTTNDLTGEHTTIMLKSLNAEDDPELGNWMGDFFQEFRQRLINLLGFQFRKFDPQLAMSLMFIRNNPALTEMREKCKRIVWTPKQLRLVFSNRDLRRLSQYSKNMVDHHLITDLVPTLASLFFTEKFAESVILNAIQSAILVAIGLQHKTVDELSPELNLPVNQILAIFLKGIRTLSEYLDECFLNGMEEDIEESRKAVVKNVVPNDNDENMEKLRSLDEDLQEGEASVKKQQQKDKEEMINELRLDNYAIKGTDDEWKSAVSDINLTSVKSGVISVKSKRPESMKRPLPTFEPPGPKLKKKKLNKYKNK